MLRPVIRMALTLFLLAWVLPTISFSNWLTLIIASIVMTILYSLIRPILKIFFLPINIITLGLFSAVLNTLLLYLAIYLVPGFEITAMKIFGVHFNQFFSVMFISVLIGFVQSFIKIFI